MTLECKVRTLCMNPDDLKRCAGCDKSNIEDILLEESTGLIPFKAVAGLGYLCPECYQEETQPTPADLAALVADLNAVIAEQEARLRAQESQISEMYTEIVALKTGNRRLLELLDRCDVVMDTSAMHGLPQMLPPTYKESWAWVHGQVREELRKEAV